MIAVDSMGSFPLACSNNSGRSFHHSDSSMESFSLSCSEFPIYDEAATTPATPTNTTELSPSPSSTMPGEEDSEAESVSETELGTELEMDALWMDFSSSWPAAKHRSKMSSSGCTRVVARKPQQLLNPPQIRVRFAPTLAVRTYSIVLGDHPWCEDGLSLELGWDYEDSRDILTQTPPVPLCPCCCLVEASPSPFQTTLSSNATRAPRTRSYLERKRLLMEVGGCSESELQIRCIQATRNILLRYVHEHLAPQHEQEQQQEPEQRHLRPNAKRKNDHHNKSHNDENSIPLPRVGSVTKSLSLYAAIA